jgi:hypothetical protein
MALRAAAQGPIIHHSMAIFTRALAVMVIILIIKSHIDYK